MARWRAWLSRLPAGWTSEDLRSEADEREYRLWAARQVRRSVRRVREQLGGGARGASDLDTALSAAETALESHDVNAAAKAAQQALNVAVQAPLTSLDPALRQRVIMTVEGVRLLQEEVTSTGSSL